MKRIKNSKKPSLKKFIEAADACRGIKTNIAKAFGVSRNTVINWCNTDPEFNDVIENYKGQLLDEVIKTARIVALGIPKLKDGKVVGWIEKPDSYMLRYFMSTYGHNEGFGERLDVTTNGESIKSEPIRIEVIDRREDVKGETNEQD